MGNLLCGAFGGTSARPEQAESLLQKDGVPSSQSSAPKNTRTRGDESRPIATKKTRYGGTACASRQAQPKPNPTGIDPLKASKSRSNEDTDKYPDSEKHSRQSMAQSSNDPQATVLGDPTPMSKTDEPENLMPGSIRIDDSEVAGPVYRPPMKRAIDSIGRYVVGVASEDECAHPSYVVMLVGATGAGKSTLINGIANYVFGVRYEDPFRYKLITDVGTVGQAHSQTKQVASYTFCRWASSPVPFTVTVIDTPGFGDTEGVQRDKRIFVELKHFLSSTGFDTIHAVGFVTQASLPRLTPSQTYIIDSILSIFGKDIESSILLMTTFADPKRPPVLAALKEAGVPFHKYFKFNNSALYPTPFDKDTGNHESYDDGHLFWDLCMKGFKGFFEELTHMEARSLLQTKAVLEDREQLALLLQGLQQQGFMIVAKIEELKEEEKVLNHHKADIEANQQFTYMITFATPSKEDTKTTEHTNCRKCKFTCHENCSCPVFELRETEMKCIAFHNGACTVCPARCESADHTRRAVKFTRHIVQKKRNMVYLKSQYAQIEDDVNQEMMVAKCRKMVADQYNEAFFLVHDAQQTIAKLNALALKPKSSSGDECINVLIQLEESRKEPGYQNRVKRLLLIQREVEKLFDGDKTEYQSKAKKAALQLAGLE